MISSLSRNPKSPMAPPVAPPTAPPAQISSTASTALFGPSPVVQSPEAPSPSAPPVPPQPTLPSELENPTPPRSAAPTLPIVALSQVNKTYANGAPALIDINLTLRKGDFLFITGASGAGKSTLLKMLYGEEQPTTGSVYINGQPINQLKGDRLAMLRRRIGIVFQDYKLIPLRTVAENVAFVLHAQGYSRKEINRRLPVTLKMVGLQDKADRFPSQLSGGEQQRASIARAIVGTPPLLLADEPTGNLDSDNARQVMNILRKLNRIGITVLITTHDEHMVRSLNYPVVQIRSHRLYDVR